MTCFALKESFTLSLVPLGWRWITKNLASFQSIWMLPKPLTLLEYSVVRLTHFPSLTLVYLWGSLNLKLEISFPHEQNWKKAKYVSVWFSMARRLTLINSTLYPLPTYTICTVKLPISIINSIDQARRNCLWNGNDVNANRKPMISWDKVIAPQRKMWSWGYKSQNAQ